MTSTSIICANDQVNRLHVIVKTAIGGTAKGMARNDWPLTNPLTRFDTDRDGIVKPLDARRSVRESVRRYELYFCP